MWARKGSTPLQKDSKPRPGGAFPRLVGSAASKLGAAPKPSGSSIARGPGRQRLRRPDSTGELLAVDWSAWTGTVDAVVELVAKAGTMMPGPVLSR